MDFGSWEQCWTEVASFSVVAPFELWVGKAPVLDEAQAWFSMWVRSSRAWQWIGGRRSQRAAGGGGAA
jgi:hypothetical protein